MNGLPQDQLQRLRDELEQRKLALQEQIDSEAAEHNMAQLAIIKHALAKFADGSYGLCDNCGEAIGLSRLNARPEARLCIDCQTRLEKSLRSVP